MADQASDPDATQLDVYYAPFEIIDVPALVAACVDRWYNQTLTRVNAAVVRLDVMQGEYHWHKHEAEDEFFSKGVVHRTRAPERAVVLMVKGAGVVPTGG